MSRVPYISKKEFCELNTSKLEQLWAKERALCDPKKEPSFGLVLWKFSKERIFWTTLTYLTSILLGFIGPVKIIKKVQILIHIRRAHF